MIVYESAMCDKVGKYRPGNHRFEFRFRSQFQAQQLFDCLQVCSLLCRQLCRHMLAQILKNTEYKERFPTTSRITQTEKQWVRQKPKLVWTVSQQKIEFIYKLNILLCSDSSPSQLSATRNISI